MWKGFIILISHTVVIAQVAYLDFSRAANSSLFFSPISHLFVYVWISPFFHWDFKIHKLSSERKKKIILFNLNRCHHNIAQFTSFLESGGVCATLRCMHCSLLAGCSSAYRHKASLTFVFWFWPHVIVTRAYVCTCLM